MKLQPKLLPENGAEFFGSIQKLEDGQFQASCRAQLDDGDLTRIGSREYFTAKSYEEARAWINGMASARKFEKYFIESR